MPVATHDNVETPCHRQYFYVGGVYEEDKSTSFGGHIMRDQTYVECLTPVGGLTREYPLIFVHGGGQSGLNWLHTPDGRKGWASFFLDRGYTVYLIDTASRGRSAPALEHKHIQYPTGFVEDQFTAPKHAAKWPQAKLHTQWPGTGQRGDPIFDQFYASVLPSMCSLVMQQQATKAGLVALLERIGCPSILVTHSQGGPGGWLAADACPSLVKAIIAVEPNGPPFSGTHPSEGVRRARMWGLADIPLTFEPPITDPSEFHLVTIPATQEGRSPVILQDDRAGRAVHKLKNLQDIPVLVEVGEASYHAEYDHATVAFLRQAGVACDFVRLEELGIKGNGHMQMLELNNLAIAEVLQEWIEGKLPHSKT
ncbi:uncharacterized protein Z520_04513 [Fonsecaea multimorphosa CBS 102226]|uniref:AB hydrolase-1 domain-containing protein n=1 Tax=Fonsecaea multimorphosa CBS 102226 TaxID=1442371 RepID=A0A0D2K205_9EURO|nr:uncharacterized protein Z520_04513 [Fonsecaea multimorphosa CBS 102226]KIX99877.1 hypothetical protein Z520_04513 [Fonsecaea multimorphosa CBS 102226]OAL26355.1 hypothetical protein AYO22_04273 [Fonsecaea multimorphosa]